MLLFTSATAAEDAVAAPPALPPAPTLPTTTTTKVLLQRRLSTTKTNSTSSLRTAVTAWCSDPSAAESTYGHISAWDTSGVDDMSFLFSGYCSTASTFNADLSAWNVGRVATLQSLFRDAWSIPAIYLLGT